jgi:hypothetical protein
MKKDEIKQLKKDFAAYIEEIERYRCGKIKSKEVKRLAINFVLERHGLAKAVDMLAMDLYRRHRYDFEPETKPTIAEAKTRLCEIAAGLNRLSVMVQQAIAEEPYLSSTCQNNQ